MSYSVTRELILEKANRGLEMLKKKEVNIGRLMVNFSLDLINLKP